MNSETQTQNPSPWQLLAGVGRIVPFMQILAAALFCAVGWYVATQTASFAHNARLDAAEKKIDAMEKSFDKILTKEVYEAYRKGDVERADRVEKMLMQLLERK